MQSKVNKKIWFLLSQHFTVLIYLNHFEVKDHHKSMSCAALCVYNRPQRLVFFWLVYMYFISGWLHFETIPICSFLDFETKWIQSVVKSCSSVQFSSVTTGEPTPKLLRLRKRLLINTLANIFLNAFCYSSQILLLQSTLSCIIVAANISGPFY